MVSISHLKLIPIKRTLRKGSQLCCPIYMLTTIFVLQGDIEVTFQRLFPRVFYLGRIIWPVWLSARYHVHKQTHSQIQQVYRGFIKPYRKDLNTGSTGLGAYCMGGEATIRLKRGFISLPPVRLWTLSLAETNSQRRATVPCSRSILHCPDSQSYYDPALIRDSGAVSYANRSDIHVRCWQDLAAGIHPSFRNTSLELSHLPFKTSHCIYCPAHRTRPRSQSIHQHESILRIYNFHHGSHNPFNVQVGVCMLTNTVSRDEHSHKRRLKSSRPNLINMWADTSKHHNYWADLSVGSRQRRKHHGWGVWPSHEGKWAKPHRGGTTADYQGGWLGWRWNHQLYWWVLRFESIQWPVAELFAEFIAMMTGGGKLPEAAEPQSADSDKSIEDVIDQS